MNTTEAAEWMASELQRRRILDQDTAVYHLHKQNKALTYQNNNGNLAIAKDVLVAFRKLIDDKDVVWSRGERHWRYRQKHDKPGRMQD